MAKPHQSRTERRAKRSRKKAEHHGRRAWKTIDSATTIGSLLLAPKVSNAAWYAITGRKAPGSPRHPELGVGEAIAYAAASGAAVAVMRTLLRRGVASYWLRSTGDLPPGMSSLQGTSTKRQA